MGWAELSCTFIIALGHWAYQLVLSANFYASLGTHGNFGAVKVAWTLFSNFFYFVLGQSQCCDSFRWIAKGLSQTYTCIHFPQTPLSSRLPHNNEQSSMSCMSVLQFSSVAQSCPTLCSPMDCRTPGFPVHHRLPELTQTHVDWVGDAIKPSHPLSSPS